MGWDKIDETSWQRNKAVSLTSCWLWDETWLMRLSGKEIKQCHSLPVGHGMRHDWWDSLAKKYSSVTHFLLVMGWDIIDKTAGQRNKAVSLTPCWSWVETWLVRLPGKEIKQCCSHAVGHGMRHDWWDCLVQRNKAVPLTRCWSWHETWLRDCLAQRNKAVSLTPCGSWHETWLMKLPGKEIKQCHSQTVGCRMRHGWWDCLAKT